MAKRSKRKSASYSPSSPPAEIRTPEAAAPIRLPLLLRVAIIVVATFWVYSPIFRGDWLWDDDWYITNQPLLHDLSGLWKYWFQPGSWVEYYPLEETLLWIEWHLFGTDTLGYHLVTIALHAANALLVWRLLAKFGLRKAWLGGLLFAVHPALVESVAWIAETKNTVALLPFLLAMGAWLDFEEERRPRDYALALVFFLAAMLCKISAAPFAFAILLYAWWKRRRIGTGDFLVAAPFLVLAVALAYLTFKCGQWYASSAKLEDGAPTLTLPMHVALAGQSIGVYFAHCFWPFGLLPNYPKWSVDPASPLSFLSWLVMAGVLVWLWQKREGWGRHALLGLGFFLLFLGPFVGLISISYMSFTWVMDHFLYIPMVGIVGLVVAAVESIEDRLAPAQRPLVTVLTTAMLALLALAAHGYSVAYSDEATLWGYTVEHNPDDWLAQDNVAKALLVMNQPEEAAEHFRASLRLMPGRAKNHLNLGKALVMLDRIPEGIAEYEQAIALDPTDPAGYNQKGIALLQSGHVPEAIAQFDLALTLRPDYSLALENMGIALAQSGRLPEAVERLTAALKVDPDNADSHANLGKALVKLGRTDEALAQFKEVLRLDPQNAPALDSLEKLQGGRAKKP